MPEYITFDCYGTLVNFEIDRATVQTLGPRVNQIKNIDTFLQEFKIIRFSEVLDKYRPYKEVLCRSLEKAMSKFGLEYDEEDGAAIVAAVPTFGPFPDVHDVMERLRQHCKIVIISNTDDELIAGNVRKIGVPFDYVITAEQSKAYKPTLPAFRYALKILGCKPSDILHVAQGFYYDIVPASKLGWARVWINRNREEGNEIHGPYHELPDLSGLPALLNI